MEQTMAPVAYFMDRLQISGKEIAAALGTDETQISRWRTNRRRLTGRSRWLQPLVQYLMDVDHQRGSGLVQQVLKRYRPERSFENEQDRIDVFKDLLCEADIADFLLPPNQKTSAFSSSDQAVFAGGDGLRRALTQFWQREAQAGEHRHLIMCDFDGANSGQPETRLLPMCLQSLRKRIARGQSAQISVGSLRNDRPYESALEMTDLLLSPLVTCFYQSESRISALDYAVLVLEGDCAVLCFRLEQGDGAYRTEFCTDERDVAFCAALARDDLIRAARMVETMSVTRLAQWLAYQVRNEIWHTKSTIYRQYPMPTMRSMDETLLRDILIENNVDDRKLADCIASHRQAISMNHKKTSAYEIYDLERLEQAAEQGSYIDSELSAICGQEIVVSAPHFYRLLEGMRTQQEHSNYNRTFIPFSRLRSELQAMYIIVEMDGMLLMWSPEHFNHRMKSRLDCILLTFYHYCEECWNQVSVKEKTDSFREDMITALQLCLQTAQFGLKKFNET